MRLSEMPTADLMVGDKLISRKGNAGHIVGIYPHGTVNPITGHAISDFGSPIILICWYGSRSWSMHEQLQMTEIEYDAEATSAFRNRVAAADNPS